MLCVYLLVSRTDFLALQVLWDFALPYVNNSHIDVKWNKSVVKGVPKKYPEFVGPSDNNIVRINPK